MSCNHYPPFGVCTGHGICSDNDLCKCDDGWSSIGDFSTKEGDHCGINVNAIRVIYTIMMLPFILLFHLSVVLIKNRIQHQQQLKLTSSSGDLSKRQPSSSWKTPIAIFPIFFLCLSIVAILLATLKIVDPIKHSMALDPFTTTLFSLTCVFGVPGGCIYLLLLINFMDGYARVMSSKAGQRIRDQSNKMRLVSFAIMVYAPLPHVPPLFNISNPNHDRETMIVYSIAMMLLFFFLGFPLLRYLSIMSREIKMHLDSSKFVDDKINHETNEKFEATKNKIDKAWFFVLFTVGFSTMLYSILIFIPFMTKISSYILPMMLMPVGLVTIMFSISVMNQTNKQKKNTSSISGTSDRSSMIIINNNAVIIPKTMKEITSDDSFEMSNPSPTSSNAKNQDNSC